MTMTRLVPLLMSVLLLAPAGAALAQADNAIGMTTRHFQDTERQNWQQTGPRPLTTVVWYPTASGSSAQEIAMGPPGEPLFIAGRAVKDAPLAIHSKTYPLILLSHGTGGSALQMMWLAQPLAERGYIVAAVNHHGNTAAEAHYTPQGFTLWWERAQDLRVVLNKLLADPQFGPHIDRSRIGAAGFSLGGYTVIELAGGQTDFAAFLRFCKTPEAGPECKPQAEFPDATKQFKQMMESNAQVKSSLARSGNSYRDPRIRAVFAIAPAIGEAVTSQSLKKIDIPVEIVVGAADQVAPAEHNAQRYASLIPDAKLVILPGNVRHYTFLDACAAAGRAKLPKLCTVDSAVERATAHRRVSALALSFFDGTLAPESDKKLTLLDRRSSGESGLSMCH